MVVIKIGGSLQFSSYMKKWIKSIELNFNNSCGDPASPHFYDQAQRYADVQFKDVPFYRTDVEARAEETYMPGKRK